MNIKATAPGRRNAGVAIDDEEFEEGLRCVGAPVFDHRQRVVASISTTAPVFRLKKNRLAEVARIFPPIWVGSDRRVGSR